MDSIYNDRSLLTCIFMEKNLRNTMFDECICFHCAFFWRRGVRQLVGICFLDIMVVKIRQIQAFLNLKFYVYIILLKLFLLCKFLLLFGLNHFNALLYLKCSRFIFDSVFMDHYWQASGNQFLVLGIEPKLASWEASTLSIVSVPAQETKNNFI